MRDTTLDSSVGVYILYELIVVGLSVTSDVWTFAWCTYALLLLLWNLWVGYISCEMVHVMHKRNLALAAPASWEPKHELTLINHHAWLVFHHSRTVTDWSRGCRGRWRRCIIVFIHPCSMMRSSCNSRAIAERHDPLETVGRARAQRFMHLPKKMPIFVLFCELFEDISWAVPCGHF